MAVIYGRYDTVSSVYDLAVYEPLVVGPTSVVCGGWESSVTVTSFVEVGSVPDFGIAQYDTLPALTATLSDAEGPVDLTGATVTFSMQVGGVAVVADRACTLVDAAAGEVSVGWQAADTARAGWGFGQFTVTFPSSAGVQRFPNSRLLDIQISAALS